MVILLSHRKNPIKVNDVACARANAAVLAHPLFSDSVKYPNNAKASTMPPGKKSKTPKDTNEDAAGLARGFAKAASAAIQAQNVQGKPGPPASTAPATTAKIAPPKAPQGIPGEMPPQPYTGETKGKLAPPSAGPGKPGAVPAPGPGALDRTGRRVRPRDLNQEQHQHQHPSAPERTRLKGDEFFIR